MVSLRKSPLLDLAWVQVATIVMILNSPCHAALIGIDFNQAGESPTNWNSVSVSNAMMTTATPINRSDLIDEEGATTAVDFSLESPFGFVRGFDNTVASAETPTHTNPLNLLGGYLHNSSNANDTVTSTLSSLTPNTNYRVWVFGTRVRSAFDNRVTIFGAGLPVQFTQQGTGPSLFINGEQGSQLRSLNSYAILAESTSTGTISVEWSEGTGSSRYTIAGLAVEGVVPEPGAGVLFFAGISVLLLGRRKRQVQWAGHPPRRLETRKF